MKLENTTQLFFPCFLEIQDMVIVLRCNYKTCRENSLLYDRYPHPPPVYFMINAVSQFISQSHVNALIHLNCRIIWIIRSFLSLYRSAHGQAATHHSPRPVQSDTRGGQCGIVEVPGVRRPHPVHQLAEGWGQSAGEGLPHVPAGARQPADQKRQGKGFHSPYWH